MPSQFEQQFTAQLTDLYEESFGVAATYTPPDSTGAVSTGADGNPLVIRVQRGEARELEKNGASQEEQSAEIFVRQSQIAKVLVNSRFTIESGNEVWTIVLTPKLKNGQHYCQARRVGVVGGLMSKRGKA